MLYRIDWKQSGGKSYWQVWDEEWNLVYKVETLTTRFCVLHFENIETPRGIRGYAQIAGSDHQFDLHKCSDGELYLTITYIGEIFPVTVRTCTTTNAPATTPSGATQTTQPSPTPQKP